MACERSGAGVGLLSAEGAAVCLIGSDGGVSPSTLYRNAQTSNCRRFLMDDKIPFGASE